MEHGVAEHRDDQRHKQAHLGLGVAREIEVPDEEDEQQQGQDTDQGEDDRGGPAEVEHSVQDTARQARARRNTGGVYSPSPCERWSPTTPAIPTSCAVRTSRCRTSGHARPPSATTLRACATTTIWFASA